MPPRAKHLQPLEDLRKAKVHLYYHDEAWMNLQEAKTSIPTLKGEEKIKQGEEREILRLPKLHCSLNPIGLSGNNLKQFVHDQNTTFRQNDVKQLIKQFIVAMGNKRASSYFHHIREIEQTFNIIDAIMEEEIKSDIQPDIEERDSGDDQDNVE
ncbi:unnamed protein product [Rotaria sp. Silwood2]|nr:unnamed protein product [Rotaria sp. Silwood2]CAF3949826.1 unnamed protein product [Rotaria sp. Silwood2]CAF4323172.1 unnamed protein product [Rotaria sp. Silwood2]